jgi:hypothetical protein
MADSITAEQTLPPGYIDPEHSGADRKLLEVFYAACNSEGGTADEIHLRGIRAVLAAQPAPPAEGEVADEELLALKSWSGSTAFESDLVDICRAAIALDRSRRAPVQSADGEVAELVAWLRQNAEDERQMCESANRASLNLDRCAALLQRHQPPQPVAVSERPWEREGWCDEQGRCWLRGKVEGDWRLLHPTNSGVPQLKYCFSHSLPFHALPIPRSEND